MVQKLSQRYFPSEKILYWQLPAEKITSQFQMKSHASQSETLYICTIPTLVLKKILPLYLRLLVSFVSVSV